MTSIRWTRLDQPGEETATLLEMGNGGWHLSGIVTLGGQRIGYSVVCDPSWRTQNVMIDDVSIFARHDGTWTMNGNTVPDVHGCIDIDLNFTPSTNILPIRRLNPAVGQVVDVRAAWFRHPAMTLEPLDQTYQFMDDTHVAYTSAGGTFQRTLIVDDQGLVIDYPGIWQRV